MRARRSRRAVVAPAFLLLASAAFAAREVPYLVGRVNDNAGMLRPEARERLESTLAAFEKATGDQIAVLTIDSLDGEPLEDYSMKVAETWKLGQKGKDNGVLFLVARDDRKMRIEVGYGLEPTLTDALCKRILDNVVAPQFRAGRFDAGVEGGVDAIIGTLQGKDVVPAQGPAVRNDFADWPAKLIGLLIFTVVVGLFSLIALLGKGCQSWFLYLFLMPFWAAFPFAFFGTAGLAAIVAWVVGFPILKLFLTKSPLGKGFLAAHPGWVTFATSSGSHSGGGFSSGGFSGGGGSFGGGGASSSW